MSVSSQPPRLITAIFRDRTDAEQAYQCVSERGYDERDIDLIMSDETHKRFFFKENANRFEPNKAAPVDLNESAGVISAAVMAIGTSLVIPGVGLVLAGPAAKALSGLTRASGLMGALIERGVPQESVEHYEQEIKDGGILIGVRTQSERDAQYFEQQWKEHRAEHVNSRTQA